MNMIMLRIADTLLIQRKIYKISRFMMITQIQTEYYDIYNLCISQTI